MDIIFQPSPEQKRTWGLLAHVSDEARKELLALPERERRIHMAEIARRVREEGKRRRQGGW